MLRTEKCIRGKQKIVLREEEYDNQSLLILEPSGRIRKYHWSLKWPSLVFPSKGKHFWGRLSDYGWQGPKLIIKPISSGINFLLMKWIGWFLNKLFLLSVNGVLIITSYIIINNISVVSWPTCAHEYWAVGPVVMIATNALKTQWPALPRPVFVERMGQLTANRV